MFTAAYTISQGSDISYFTLTDTSSYASEGQGTFSSRRIYLYQADGTTKVPTGTTTSYIDFPFADGNSINISVLDRDYAFNIELELISTSPQPSSTYTKYQVYGFYGYADAYAYGLIQGLAANDADAQSSTFQSGREMLEQNIDDVIRAVYYQDLGNAQAACQRAYEMIQNPKIFF